MENGAFASAIFNEMLKEAVITIRLYHRLTLLAFRQFSFEKLSCLFGQSMWNIWFSFDKSHRFILFLLILVFWVVTPCKPVASYQRFGGTYYLHLHSLIFTAVRTSNIISWCFCFSAHIPYFSYTDMFMNPKVEVATISEEWDTRWEDNQNSATCKDYSDRNNLVFEFDRNPLYLKIYFISLIVATKEINYQGMCI
jgi:hypothetical protein